MSEVFKIPFECRLQDLFFALSDHIIDCPARCVEAEVNEWVGHCRYAAYHWGFHGTRAEENGAQRVV